MLWHFFGSLNPCFPQVLWWFCFYICHLFLKILALKVHKLSRGLYFWGLCLTHWDSHEALPCQEEPVEDPELCSLSRHLLLALIWVEIHLFQWIWVWRNRTTAGARAGVCRAGKYSPPLSSDFGIHCSRLFLEQLWVKIQTPENWWKLHVQITYNSGVSLRFPVPLFLGGPCAILWLQQVWEGSSSPFIYSGMEKIGKLSGDASKAWELCSGASSGMWWLLIGSLNYLNSDDRSFILEPCFRSLSAAFLGLLHFKPHPWSIQRVPGFHCSEPNSVFRLSL